MKIKNTVIFTVIILSLAGCGGYNKLMKSTDYNLKYSKALEYYNKGKKNYDKALALFNDISPAFEGSDREDTILFYTGKIHFSKGEFDLSVQLFDQFRNKFNRTDPFMEECEYLFAMSHFNLSPEPERDQTETKQAIGAINNYLVRYPDSHKKADCLKYLDELQQKLYDQSFLNARTYYNIGRYNSAVFALKNALVEYPQSPHREEIMYLICVSGYEYAKRSIETKQRERYLQFIDYYYNFASEFSESKYSKEIQDMYKTVEKTLNLNKSEE